MKKRSLKFLTIVLPVATWILFFITRYIFNDGRLNLPLEALLIALMAAGSIVFSNWVFGIIEQNQAEVQSRSDQLAALHEAALTLTTELELHIVLQKVVDLARELTNARYAALGVLKEDGRFIDQFITSGLDAETRSRLGEPPQGHGLLGVLIHEGKTLIVDEISKDPRSAGFPPNHPPMHSLIGVPIRFKGRVIGDLYLTDKLSKTTYEHMPFQKRDQQILEMFATQAAIAIENAMLYRQMQQLTILQERERFGMDLHDGIIQSIYAIGLMLENTQLQLPPEETEVFNGLSRANQGLNEVIRDIRNYILDLRPHRFQGRNLRGGLEELARDLRANTFLNVELAVNTTVPANLSPEQTVEILHIAQEALSNIRKHARATRVQIDLAETPEALVLRIVDDGVGIDLKRANQASGNGLRNIRERANSLRGEIHFAPNPQGGTEISLRVPL